MGCGSSNTSNEAKHNKEDKIKEWLKHHSLDGYASILIKNGYDSFEALVLISESDLESLNMKQGHIKLLLHNITKLDEYKLLQNDDTSAHNTTHTTTTNTTAVPPSAPSQVHVQPTGQEFAPPEYGAAMINTTNNNGQKIITSTDDNVNHDQVEGVAQSSSSISNNYESKSNIEPIVIYDGVLNNDQRNNNKDIIDYKISYNKKINGYEIELKHTGFEHFINLKYPSLLGKDCLPFKVEFNVEFIGGHHGGIHFGHQYNEVKVHRWMSVQDNVEKTPCTVIDWLGHIGFRLYGTTKECKRNNENDNCRKVHGWDGNGKWKIVFNSENNAIFYYDDGYYVDKVYEFVPKSINGSIGFWTHTNGGMKISNLVVEQI